MLRYLLGLTSFLLLSSCKTDKAARHTIEGLINPNQRALVYSINAIDPGFDAALVQAEIPLCFGRVITRGEVYSAVWARDSFQYACSRMLQRSLPLTQVQRVTLTNSGLAVNNVLVGTIQENASGNYTLMGLCTGQHENVCDLVFDQPSARVTIAMKKDQVSGGKQTNMPRPMDPTKPMDPAKPMDPTKPMEPKPTDPMMPVDTQPKDPNRPRPFPQALTYKQGLMPEIPAAERNQMVMNAYQQWKQKYLKFDNRLGGFYVEAVGTNTRPGFITHSEAHGWGMLITALMAGGDSEAKRIFDGLYRVFDQYRASSHDGLMAWQVLVPKTQEASATDGDLDIAYALLLAHYQWGSNGTINYLAQARRTIAGIRERAVNRDRWIVPGDWAQNRVPEIARSSDFMTSHFRAFGRAEQPEFWNSVTVKSNEIARRMSDSFRAQGLVGYGLMPDFIESYRNSEGYLLPRRPLGQVLEKADDRNFNWNANRYPWRITMDYLLHGDKDSQVLGQMASDFFLRIVTDYSFNPNNIDFARFKAGYSIEGQALVGFNSAAFTAPAMVAVMAQQNPERTALARKVLTDGYRYLASMNGDYYGDSIRVLCMLVMSGNYWSPVE